MQLEFGFKTYVISVHVNDAKLEYTAPNAEHFSAIVEKMQSEGFQLSPEYKENTKWTCVWVCRHQVEDFDQEFPILRDKLVDIVKEYGGRVQELFPKGNPRYLWHAIKAYSGDEYTNNAIINAEYDLDEYSSPSAQLVSMGNTVAGILKKQIGLSTKTLPTHVGRIETSNYRVHLYVLRGVYIPALSERLSQEEGFKAAYNVSGEVGYPSNCRVPYRGTHDVRESGKSIVEVRERLKAILTELGLTLRPNDYFEDRIDLFRES